MDVVILDEDVSDSVVVPGKAPPGAAGWGYGLRADAGFPAGHVLHFPPGRPVGRRAIRYGGGSHIGRRKGRNPRPAVVYGGPLAEARRILNGTDGASPIELLPASVRALNSLQILHADGFVYGPKDEFGSAREMIRERQRLPHRPGNASRLRAGRAALIGRVCQLC